MGDYANLGSFFVAICAVYWAIHEHRANSSAKRVEHINGLFREILSIQIAHQSQNFDDSANRKLAELRIHSFKMWVLEEMWMWLEDLKRRRNKIEKSCIRRILRKFCRDDKILIEGWDNTLSSHLRQSPQEAWIEFVQWRGCYHPGFYEEVSRQLGEQGIALEGLRPVQIDADGPRTSSV